MKIKSLRSFINRVLSCANLKITNLEIFNKNLEFDRYFGFINKWKAGKLNPNFKSFLLENFQDSNSQLQQDLVVDYLFSQEIERKHFFVEFGATDGISLSNTYYLEKHKNWDGILAEPAKIWHSSLFSNRKVEIDTRAVFAESNLMLKFTQDEIVELSGLSSFKDLSSARKKSLNYEVTTVSLNDLLKFYKAPSVIDYLSIDTEGSELEIIEDFDFVATRFRFISIEHNYREDRKEIREILSKHGYSNIMSEFSDFDDWYLHENDLHLLIKIYGPA